MRTTNDPYSRKVGLNVANCFISQVTSNNIDYLNIVFNPNEREALGRRVLIMLCILEGLTQTDTIGLLGCGKNTYTKIKRELNIYQGDTYKLKNFLLHVYKKQLPKKKQDLSKYKGSKNAIKTLKILGIID